MRLLRRQMLGDAGGNHFYHVVSRVVNRDLVFGEVEKEHFRRLLERQLKFSGLRAVAWCCMGNHFHLLLEVPDKEAALQGWSEDECWRRLKILAADEAYSRSLLSDVEMWKASKNREALRKLADRVRARLFDLSAFMKELKQKFAAWFNLHHERRGTLWEERFKSVLLEAPKGGGLVENQSAVTFVSAYIDLNPVRAGLVDDPKDYRWCGYASAVSGNREARRGIARALSGGTGRGGRGPAWRTVSRGYRKFLFSAGIEHGAGITASGRHAKKARRGFSPEQVEKTWKAGGTLSLEEVLYCRVRYVSDGLVLGSREFLEDYFEKRRQMFGKARKTGARGMKGAEWDGLMSLRDLSQNAVSAARPGE